MSMVPIVRLAAQAREGPSPPLKLLRFPAVRARTGLSRSTIWRLERVPALRTRAELVRWLDGQLSRPLDRAVFELAPRQPA